MIKGSARSTCSIELSIYLADFTGIGSNLDVFHSSQFWCYAVLLWLVLKMHLEIQDDIVPTKASNGPMFMYIAYLLLTITD